MSSVGASVGWAKLTDAERADVADRLTALNGVTFTDRAEVSRRLGPLPKDIQKAAWDAVAVRDPGAPVPANRLGGPEPDPDLRGNENVPLPSPIGEYDEDPAERLATPLYRAAVDAYMAEEVLPFVAEAWVDQAKTKIGYEIPLTRQFYRYVLPRPLQEIDAEITALENEIQRLLGEVTT